MKILKIGTDFSGIGSPEMALELLGIAHKKVFACEIDKHARNSYKAIFGEPGKFYNDITTRNHKEVEQLDLYISGFPCQAFSLAGKRKGFEDTRGTLFFNVAEFIKENQPKAFILENVKGLLSHDSGKTFDTIKAVLSDNGGTINGQASFPFYEDGLGYHIYYQVLNTKDYGIPQNRERIFIVGFKDFRRFSFPKPFKLDLRLKDILQDNPKTKYFLSEKAILKCQKSQANKNLGKEKNPEISRCLISGYYKIPFDGQYIVNDKVIQLNNSKESGGQQPYQQNRVYAKEGISPALNTLWNGGNIINTQKIRRLTPLECWRLQAFPDEAFFKAQKVNSDTQLYKQAGNSISVNVMAAILKKVYE